MPGKTVGVPVRRHSYAVVDGAEHALEVSSAFVLAGLAGSERVTLIGLTDRRAGSVLTRLREDGADPDTALRDGQLAIADRSRTEAVYRMGAQQLTDEVSRQATAAVRDGYRGLRLGGLLLGAEPSPHERTLTRMVRAHPVTVLCLFHPQITAEALADVHALHDRRVPSTALLDDGQVRVSTVPGRALRLAGRIHPGNRARVLSVLTDAAREGRRTIDAASLRQIDPESLHTILTCGLGLTLRRPQIQGPVPAFAAEDVQIGGQGGIPLAGVAGVVATVTVVDPQGAGYLTVWPSGTAMPGTSNLTFQAGQTIAATVIVPVSAAYALRLYNGSSGSLQVIVDVSGYILSGTPTAAGTIGPVTARIADSRLGLQIPGAVPALGSTAVQVAAPGSGVAAAVATVTVVDPQADGYVTVWRSGTRQPGTSNLNFQAGQTAATTMIVPIGRDGKIQLFNGSPGAMQVVVDITGYTLTGAGVHGAVWAWGGAEEGQLGDGSTTNSPVPVPVFGLTDVTAVAGGGLAGYALRRDGTVWSWGDGSSGALGDGDDESYSTVPVQVWDLDMTRVTAIAAGTRAAYALDADGHVWAWGDGFYGALGNNSTLGSKIPVRLSGLSDVTVTAVAGGLSTGYTVGSDGAVRAWGWGQYGQLGNNSTADSLVPVQV
ncbi:MAG TPA: MEDS domain-containing protein, partial [Nakamurella sp.]